MGLLLGACGARWRWFGTLVGPVMQLIRAMPVASFVILALLWVSGKNLSVIVSFTHVLPVVYAGTCIDPRADANIRPYGLTEGDTVTISGGLTAPGIRGHYDAEGAPGDSVVITGANGTNTFSLLSPIFTEIRGEMVPEPATVSLGLLGLAALMMRRRRA